MDVFIALDLVIQVRIPFDRLLPDTELPENSSEYVFIDIDLTGDGANVSKGVPEMKGQ